MKQYVPLQTWSCDKCIGRGQVEAPIGISYEALMLRIHDQHIETSPECADEHGVFYVRLAQTSPLPD